MKSSALSAGGVAQLPAAAPSRWAEEIAQAARQLDVLRLRLLLDGAPVEAALASTRDGLIQELAGRPEADAVLRELIRLGSFGPDGRDAPDFIFSPTLEDAQQLHLVELFMECGLRIGHRQLARANPEIQACVHRVKEEFRLYAQAAAEKRAKHAMEHYSAHLYLPREGRHGPAELNLNGKLRRSWISPHRF